MFRYRDRWHVYFTTADSAGRWSLGHTSFAQWYRSRTTLAEFPNGFRDTAVVLSEPNRFDLFEAGNVYRLGGDGGGYLMLVEALATGSDWRRYFRAWTRDFSHGEMIRAGVDQTLSTTGRPGSRPC